MQLLTLVLASANEGKLRELRVLLAELPVQVLSARDVLGEDLAIAETGSTFEENAILKARAVCRATRLISISDDSGLEVAALGGRPGVRSARFAHERATDAQNNAQLLKEMELVDPAERSARFRCVLALATPYSDEVQTVEGACDGTIARAPRGSGGFGYDPLFLVDDQSGRSMAELTEEEKNQISHRSVAVRRLKPVVAELVRGLLEGAGRALSSGPLR